MLKLRGMSKKEGASGGCHPRFVRPCLAVRLLMQSVGVTHQRRLRQLKTNLKEACLIPG